MLSPSSYRLAILQWKPYTHAHMNSSYRNEGVIKKEKEENMNLGRAVGAVSWKKLEGQSGWE